MDSEQLEQLRNTRCFEVAEKIATSVEREFEIDLPVEEVGLHFHPPGRQALAV